MSLKSKLLNFAVQAKDSYKFACEKSKDAWQNSDCSIPESVKESTKLKFALWAKDKVPHDSSTDGYRYGYDGYGYYQSGFKIHD